jgi:hypothetical protein
MSSIIRKNVYTLPRMIKLILSDFLYLEPFETYIKEITDEITFLSYGRTETTNLRLIGTWVLGLVYTLKPTATVEKCWL